MREKIFPALKVPRQCPFYLLREVGLKEGKALESKQGKWLGCGFCYEQGMELEHSFM
jgi:hypothetical protein